jgi:hypothetical protein
VPRDIEQIQSDIDAAERALGTWRAKTTREQGASNAKRYFAGLRGSVRAQLPARASVVSGFASSLELAQREAAFLYLASPGSEARFLDECEPELKDLPSEKDRARKIAEIEKRIAKLDEEAGELELQQLRDDLRARTQRFEAERNAERNAA